MALESCYLFADNCVVVTGGENPDISTESMQESIKLASDWYSENCLDLNSAKTDVMTNFEHRQHKSPRFEIWQPEFKTVLQD